MNGEILTKRCDTAWCTELIPSYGGKAWSLVQKSITSLGRTTWMKQDEGSFDHCLEHCIETQEYTQTGHYKNPNKLRSLLSFWGYFGTQVFPPTVATRGAPLISFPFQSTCYAVFTARLQDPPQHPNQVSHWKYSSHAWVDHFCPSCIFLWAFGIPKLLAELAMITSDLFPRLLFFNSLFFLPYPPFLALSIHVPFSLFLL